MYNVLSFSGGKDSTALLLGLIEKQYKLDEVVFYDTGWEYPQMYEHIDKCKALCEQNNIKFTTLKPENSFDYCAFELPHTSPKDKIVRYGYGWCGGYCRWGTSLKTRAIRKYLNGIKEKILYLGIASNEVDRLKNIKEDYKKCPLVEWGLTEEDCLKICYNSGFTWGGMYENLDRLSCKFCKNKNLKELRNIRKYYPEVWEELKEFQIKVQKPYRKERWGEVTIHELEKRFVLEDEWIKAGKSIKTKEFFNAVREMIFKDRENKI